MELLAQLGPLDRRVQLEILVRWDHRARMVLGAQLETTEVLELQVNREELVPQDNPVQQEILGLWVQRVLLDLLEPQVSQEVLDQQVSKVYKERLEFLDPWDQQDLLELLVRLDQAVNPEIQVNRVHVVKREMLV
jgi:hypothetical protein